MSAMQKLEKRNIVRGDFDNKQRRHGSQFRLGQVETECYIYENQWADAQEIVALYKKGYRVVSVKKRTKVGMDGLMLAVAFLMCTDEDDDFMVEYENVRILTGMSNVGWETDMVQKSPECFEKCIFHHGKLNRSDLDAMGRNAFMIIDEIDSGTAKLSKLHKALRKSGIWNCANMEGKNHRFLFDSATLTPELRQLEKWGELHANYTMQIPSNYIGHGDFLKYGIIQEFYPLLTVDACHKWLREDVLAYGTDFRVHIVRVKSGDEGLAVMARACLESGIKTIQHTSDTNSKTEDTELKTLFNGAIIEHVVVMVKGLFRRANLIPNSWKLKIGAVHEFYTEFPDTSVQVQGLPGRMSGYWRKEIEGGHRVGPIRTSVAAIQEYEKAYTTPGAAYHGGRAESMLESSHVGIAVEDTSTSPVFDRVKWTFKTKEENDARAKEIGNREPASLFHRSGLFWMCYLPAIDRMGAAEMAENGFSRKMQVQPVADLERYMDLQTELGMGHSRGSSIHTVPVGQFLSRKYVAYANPTDPASVQFYTLAFLRTA